MPRITPRKCCVITGTRAEYSLLKPLMQTIQTTPLLALQLIVTGQHLMKPFGLTYRLIEKDRFPIHYKVNLSFTKDDAYHLTRAMGRGLAQFADAFQKLSPDLVIILGDRYEILVASTAAMMAKIPIAHIHGGESTEGAMDEAIRHAVTKLSHLHFVAAEPYYQRVMQLGEHPDRIFLVGGLGIEAIRQTPLLEKQILEKKLDFTFSKKNLLITFHPVTLEKIAASHAMNALLSALHTLKETHCIFTAPNADIGHAVLFKQIQQFCRTHATARFYPSLGPINYFSCMQYVDAVVGNSSSGLLEAPTFKIGTINIGDRQKGRLKAASVIDCTDTQTAITKALKKLYSPAFQASLRTVSNPYDHGQTSQKIVNVLKKVNLNTVLKKSFYTHSATMS